MNPYNDHSSKRDQVRTMFDAIAPTYDLLNHLMSFGVDRRWRKRVVRELKNNGFTRILDVATGTGDLAFAIARGIAAAHVVGCDLSPQMVEVARSKVAQNGLGERVSLQVADVEQLPFESGTFDAVTVGFGVRNFQNIEAGLSEMRRVLRPGGELVVLEFSTPRNPLFGAVYRFYFHRIIPAVGRLVSKDGRAYRYLPESVDEFPSPERFQEMMVTAGFATVRSVPLFNGVTYMYVGVNGLSSRASVATRDLKPSCHPERA